MARPCVASALWTGAGRNWQIRERTYMKVFIQVPCLNEEETLPAVLQSIPTQIDGVDEIEILVIDDGSSDRTLAVAR